MNIEIEIEHGADIASGVDIEGITQYVLEQEGCPATTEVSITLTTDEEVHRLNKEYRGIDRPTDVLSFECDGLDDDFDGGAAYDDAGVPDDEPFMLGDIIIAFTAFCNILPSLHYVLGLAARHQVTTILKWPKTIVYFPYVVMIAILMLYALVEIYEYIMVLCGNAYYIEKMKNEDKSEAEHAIEESLAQENIDLTSIDFSSGHSGSAPAPDDGKNDVSKTDDAGKEDK